MSTGGEGGGEGRAPFARFTDQVCGQILFRPAHRRVRAELTAHLEDRAQALTEQGVPPEEAEERAVAAMGDPKAIGRALHRQHWPILGWIELLWPAAVMLVILLRFFVTPYLPGDLYLRLAGVDPGQVIFSNCPNQHVEQSGVFITREGAEYHFYRTAIPKALALLVSDEAVAVICHVSCDPVTGEVTWEKELPWTYGSDVGSGDGVHLRFFWETNENGMPTAGWYHVGLLPAEDIEPAWRGDLYREIGNDLALFAGYESDW